MNNKIKGYKNQDKDRPYKFNEYINVSWILQKYKKQKAVCCHCGDFINLLPSNITREAYSVDRQDNKLAHLQSNCRLAHVGCNASQK